VSGHERGHVSGYLCWFEPASRDKAWETVTGFEPGTQYKYDLVAVSLGDEQAQANALLGRQLGRGIAPESADRWSAVSDPLFVEGLAEVLTMTIETAPVGVAAQPDRPELWTQFFRLQAAYLLLWSVVERYTALRYGPVLETGERIRRLGGDTAFQAAVVEAGAVQDLVYDSRNPANKDELKPFRDGQLVLKALVELHDAMRILLARQLPATPDEWQRHQDGDGWLLRPRLRHRAHTASMMSSGGRASTIFIVSTLTVTMRFSRSRM
jgi:hypothetical protein